MRSIFLGAGGVVLAASLGLSGCGSTPATSTNTTVHVGATNFVTLPVTPSTNSPVTSGEALAGTIIEGESTYVVQANDYPSTVAHKFHVKYEDFMALNEFELDDNGFLPGWQAGITVKIPAGATVPESDGSPASVTQPGVTAAETTQAPATTEKVCVSDEPYTIKSGDAPQNVASRFNTTVNKLNQANGGTPGYANFVVGTVIKIPVDC